jgi:hypothetical protein
MRPRPAIKSVDGGNKAGSSSFAFQIAAAGAGLTGL